MYRTNRDRVAWLMPLVFPIIATSRQGIDFDISSAGLMNNSPGNRIETVYIIHFFLQSLMRHYTARRSFLAYRDWQPILNRLKKNKHRWYL